MACRPVYEAINVKPFFRVVDTEFVFYSGFALSRIQKSIISLHEAYCKAKDCEPKEILEISTKSPSLLGTSMSAFNLDYSMYNGQSRKVEVVYQSSKCFENGQQYIDLLEKTCADAKHDERLRNSGKITGFRLGGVEYPTEPVNAFYDWLYISALLQNGFDNKLTGYKAFTDIAFNPHKSINNQARSTAIFVGLCNAGIINDIMKDYEYFLSSVYETAETTQQISIWDCL